MDIVFEILLFCIEVIGTMDQYQINLMIFCEHNKFVKKIDNTRGILGQVINACQFY